jgi:hypothetical protein
VSGIVTAVTKCTNTVIQFWPGIAALCGLIKDNEHGDKITGSDTYIMAI